MGFRDVRRRQCPPELADDLTNNTLTYKELLNQFKTIEQMTKQDKDVVKTLIDAFITKAKIKILAL